MSVERQAPLALGLSQAWPSVSSSLPLALRHEGGQSATTMRPPPLSPETGPFEEPAGRWPGWIRAARPSANKGSETPPAVPKAVGQIQTPGYTEASQRDSGRQLLGLKQADCNWLGNSNFPKQNNKW